MQNRSSKERLIFIILVIMVILLFNFIINKRVIRIDLTEDKRYTISGSSKNILSELDDIINMDIYFSRDLPPQFRNLEEEVKSLLEELQAYAGRNLHIEYHNPKENPDMEYRLQSLQIPKVRANIIEKDRAQVVEIYLGMVIFYQDRKEIIPVVQNTANLEYEILSKILKVKTDKRHNVRLVFDPSRYQGAEAQMMTHHIMHALFSENFSYGAVAYNEFVFEDEIDLIIIMPLDEPEDEFLYGLDQYLLKGRPAVFFIGGMRVHPQTMMASPYESAILEMLLHYGINIDGSLVIDSSNSMASFRADFGYFSTQYPFWVAVRPENIDRSSPITAGLEGLTLPYVSPVTLVDPPVSGEAEWDGEYIPLFTSTMMSYRKYSPVNLNPQQEYEFRRDMQGLIPLGGLFNIDMDSYFKDNAKPAEDSEFLQRSAKKSTLAVFGSEHILYDFFLQNNENNIVFVQNLVDWYTLGEDLIGIRSKQIIQRPLKQLSDTQRKYIKWLAVITIPVILLIFGLIKLIVKRHSRRLAMQR